jgi:hypothetical protein
VPPVTTGERAVEREGDRDAAGIPPMDPVELEAIGTELYGRVGWPVKIAALVGKDASTVRRWRSGQRVDSAFAKLIRDHHRQSRATGEPSWKDRYETSGPLQALRLVAQAQALAASGHPVSVRVTDGPEGLAISIWTAPGRPPHVAWGDGSRFLGLEDAERTLEHLRGESPRT